MREKLIKKRNELLQKVADFIYAMLEISMQMHNDNQFDFWMWKALSLDYWCVEKNIYLN